MADENIENIYIKINKARALFQQKNIKKSGINPFHKSSYFELEDIVPASTEICNKLGLFTLPIILKNEAILNVVDCVSRENVEFRISIPEISSNQNSNSAMQSAGGRVTYARRYLYLLFLDIVEPDQIDGKDKGESVTKKKPIVSTPKKLKNKPLSSMVKSDLIPEHKLHKLRTETGLNIALNNLQKESKKITYDSILEELKLLKRNRTITVDEKRASKQHMEAILWD